jgi:hypothetical protein
VALAPGRAYRELGRAALGEGGVITRHRRPRIFSAPSRTSTASERGRALPAAGPLTFCTTGLRARLRAASRQRTPAGVSIRETRARRARFTPGALERCHAGRRIATYLEQAPAGEPGRSQYRAHDKL